MWQKKLPGGLIVGALAAYAYYRYSQMTDEEKKKLKDDLLAKGQRLYEQYVPEDIRNMVSGKGDSLNTSNNFDEANIYS